MSQTQHMLNDSSLQMAKQTAIRAECSTSCHFTTVRVHLLQEQDEEQEEQDERVPCLNIICFL